MTVKAIAYSYWRSIKRGTREFAKIPDNVKDDVRYLAKQEVVNGDINEEDYAKYIGEDYVA